MLEKVQLASILLGRIFLSLLFVLSGLNHIFTWDQSVSGLLVLFADWSSYLHQYEWMRDVFIEIAPWTPWVLSLAISVEILGGVLLFIGNRTRLAALILILFLIPVTILCHQFWFLQGPQRTLEMVMFLKNFAIVGGLFLVLAHGADLTRG